MSPQRDNLKLCTLKFQLRVGVWEIREDLSQRQSNIWNET